MCVKEETVKWPSVRDQLGHANLNTNEKEVPFAFSATVKSMCDQTVWFKRKCGT